MPSTDALAALKQASQGLTYQSETDAPWTPFTWGKAEGALTAQKVRKLAKVPAKAPVQEVAVADFFKGLTTAQDWHGEEEKAAVAKYQALQRAVQHALPDAKVYKVGERQVAVYLVGTNAANEWAGLETTAVET